MKRFLNKKEFQVDKVQELLHVQQLQQAPSHATQSIAQAQASPPWLSRTPPVPHQTLQTRARHLSTQPMTARSHGERAHSMWMPYA